MNSETNTYSFMCDNGNLFQFLGQEEASVNVNENYLFFTFLDEWGLSHLKNRYLSKLYHLIFLKKFYLQHILL